MQGSHKTISFEPSLSPRFITYVRDYLMDRGIDPGPIFAESGIPYSQAEEQDGSLPVHKVATLFELAAKYSDNPCMGMNMGQQFHYEAGSLLTLAMLAAPSVAEGIKLLSHYDKFIDSGIETVFNFNAPMAEFGARLIASDEVSGDQINEYLMTFVVRTLNVATRQRVPVKQVWFCHRGSRNQAQLEAFFGAPVKYSQPYNKVFFDKSFLQERFFTSNALLLEILTNAMKTYFSSGSDQNTFVDVVCREMIRGDTEESLCAEGVAARLAVSPRTLRRRLAEEGYSFQEAKNLARRKRAQYLLSQTRMPLSEIAFELGYSELSAFSRAFRGWVGVTPQNYRENYRHFLGA
jgi:AraC-like DNA-binding protein